MSMRSALSTKYARAFMNAFEHDIMHADIDNVYKLIKCFSTHQLMYVSLRIPSIPLQVRKDALEQLAHAFELGNNFLTLFTLLLRAGRIAILNDVLADITTLFNQMHNITYFTVTTSHTITSEQEAILKRLVASMTQDYAKTEFALDKRLIVGIRIESNQSLWERSIRKELIDASKVVIKKGIPC